MSERDTPGVGERECRSGDQSEEGKHVDMSCSYVVGSLIAPVRTHNCAQSTRSVQGAADVVVPSSIQEQSPDLQEDVNMVPCTQVPPALQKGALKRVKKPVPVMRSAHGGGGVLRRRHLGGRRRGWEPWRNAAWRR